MYYVAIVTNWEYLDGFVLRPMDVVPDNRKSDTMLVLAFPSEESALCFYEKHVYAQPFELQSKFECFRYTEVNQHQFPLYLI